MARPQWERRFCGRNEEKPGAGLRWSRDASTQGRSDIIAAGVANRVAVGDLHVPWATVLTQCWCLPNDPRCSIRASRSALSIPMPSENANAFSDGRSWRTPPRLPPRGSVARSGWHHRTGGHSRSGRARLLVIAARRRDSVVWRTVNCKASSGHRQRSRLRVAGVVPRRRSVVISTDTNTCIWITRNRAASAATGWSGELQQYASSAISARNMAQKSNPCCAFCAAAQELSLLRAKSVPGVIDRRHAYVPDHDCGNRAQSRARLPWRTLMPQPMSSHSSLASNRRCETVCTETRHRVAAIHVPCSWSCSSVRAAWTCVAARHARLPERIRPRCLCAVDAYAASFERHARLAGAFVHGMGCFSLRSRASRSKFHPHHQRLFDVIVIRHTAEDGRGGSRSLDSAVITREMGWRQHPTSLARPYTIYRQRPWMDLVWPSSRVDKPYGAIAGVSAAKFDRVRCFSSARRKCR